MKRLLISMLVLGFATSMTALAKDVKKDCTTDKTKMEASGKHITVMGKIAKEEAKKAGEKAKYQLITKDGKIDLPDTKIVDIDKMIGKEVTVVGEGKHENKKVHLKSIKSIIPETAKAEVDKVTNEVKAEAGKVVEEVKAEVEKVADEME